MYLNTSIRMRGLYSGVITICFALFGDSKSKGCYTTFCCWYQKNGFKAIRKTQNNDLNNSPNATSGGNNYFQLLLSNTYVPRCKEASSPRAMFSATSFILYF